MRVRSIVAVLLLIVAPPTWASGCGDGPDDAPPPVSRLGAPVLTVPLADAAAGESLVIGGGEAEFAYSVRSGDALRLEVELVRHVGGVPVDGPSQREVWSRNLWGIPSDGVVRRIQYEPLRIGQRWYEAWKLFLFSENEPRAYWVSSAFPVNGLLQTARVIKGREEIELAYAVRRDSFGALESAAREVVASRPGLALAPPLADAEEGDVLVLGSASAQITYRIVTARKLDVDVEIRRRSEATAPWGPPSAETWNRNGFGVEGRGVIEAFVHDPIELHGVSLDTWRMTVVSDGARFAWWIDPAAPAHGVVRVAPLDADGTPQLDRGLLRLPDVR